MISLASINSGDFEGVFDSETARVEVDDGTSRTLGEIFDENTQAAIKEINAQWKTVPVTFLSDTSGFNPKTCMVSQLTKYLCTLRFPDTDDCVFLDLDHDYGDFKVYQIGFSTNPSIIVRKYCSLTSTKLVFF